MSLCRLWLIAGFLLAWFLPVQSLAQAFENTPVYQIEVLNSYSHDPQAFTQGLAFSEGLLYEGTGQKGRSSLRLVELESGELLKRRNLNRRYFGEGITILNDKIYQLTWRSQLGFVYDKATFSLLHSFYLSGEGWGITDNGKELIVSDGTAVLRFLDPQTQQEIHRIQVIDSNGPVDKLNELEYINNEIWANVWYADYIVRIDPETGRVNSKVDLSDLNTERKSTEDVLNGIAWDEKSQRLFVTGKLWESLYEIRILE